MSRSLGLREDRRVREVLVALVSGLFPLDPVGLYREQARSHRSGAVLCGSEPARDEAITSGEISSVLSRK
ncbi:hypothetical protein SRABI112_00629 [Pseudomonas mediterranea]|uniref:Uncharacterized protein n=1 Tax=Pseudomonas mediterranea TaxID=183795 RepID=A0AAX2D7P2_9PSED|nr:hypothetical protein SRABI112_00629 [Pseudomonas mediterranea]SDU24630.1 hypothetical protein SAMN05216476_1097 [Pseudomonas mediterranea]